MSVLPSCSALLAVVAAALPAAAQHTIRPIEYSTFTLDNGLQFIVHRDHSTPIVAVNVYYDIGSAHDPPGRSGFAHLFEHLFFEETEDLERGELDRLLSAAGARWNGMTGDDRTAYFEVVPSNRLNLALWIEAQRMARLRVTDANFRREREVVKEERLLRIENQPYGRSYEMLDTLAMDYPPYDRAGSTKDLEAATVEDVREFYHSYYHSRSAVIVVAGDATVAQVRTLAEQYFGDLPAGPEIPPLSPVPLTPRTTGERRATLHDSLARVPQLYLAYNASPQRDEDSYALSLLTRILGESKSSRLYRRLVEKEQVAQRVSSFLITRLGPGLLVFNALPNQTVPVERLERLIDSEIQRLKTEGISPRELEKAKNQLRAEAVVGRLQVLSKAFALQEARLMYGDLGAVNTTLDRYMAVTTQDVARVAGKYLTPDNRTVVVAAPAVTAAGEN